MIHSFIIPFPIFISEFPFIKFKKRFSPNEYMRVPSMPLNLNLKDKTLITRNRHLLSLNQIPLNKIRFVFQPAFSYDIDKDVINPQYETFIPLRKDGSGLFDNKAPVIEFGKPEKLVMIVVNNYKVNDNYVFIKQLLKNSKRGIVIFLADDIGEKISSEYKYYVDSEIIRLSDLDEEVEKYSKIENIVYK
jgi:hypothetical protein